MGGSLYVATNDALCARSPSASSSSAPCTISPNKTAAKTGLDVFRLGCVPGPGGLARVRLPAHPYRSTLLEAASMQLDAPAPGNSSVRNEGAVVMLEIEYRNFDLWYGPSGGVTYHYKPSKLDTSHYKDVGVAARNATQRVWRNRHGVKVVALQKGVLGAFDITTLLVQLTTSCERRQPWSRRARARAGGQAGGSLLAPPYHRIRALLAPAG